MIRGNFQQNRRVVEPKIGIYNWLRRKGKPEAWEPAQEIKQESEAESSSFSEEEDYYEIYHQTPQYYEECPPDFWKVKKLTSNLRRGNPAQTALILMCLKTCDFSDPVTLQAIKDNNELSIIMNLLTCEDNRVKIAALSCLAELAKVKSIRYEIVYFGGLKDMVPLLAEPSLHLRLAAANCIADIAVFHRARKIVRMCDGIPLLANLLFHAHKYFKVAARKRHEEEKTLIRIKAATAAARALTVLCEDNKNKRAFWKCGALRACAYIVSSNTNVHLLSAVVGLIQTCAAKKCFRTAMRDMGALHSIRRHLHSEDRHLTQTCSQAVFKCAEDIRTSEFFGEAGFLEKIYELTVNQEHHGDEELMSSLTGALWKCMKSSSNFDLLHKHDAIPILLSLLSSNFSKVHVHVVGCLTLCFRHRPSRQDIIKHDGPKILARMLNTTDSSLIVNLTRAIAEASHDPVCLDLFERNGTVEKLWSHLRNNDPWVASNAAWNLCPILINMKDTSACVRSLIGAIEVIEKLLNSPYTRISTPACKIVAILAQEKDNLSLLTDYGMARLLSEKVTTKCKRLRYYLCMAIYTCCPSKDNAQVFSQDTVLKSLLRMLRSKCIEVRVAACRVLWRLSAIPRCCLMIYESKKAVSILMNLLCNENAQEWAAGIIQNIRLFSLAQEKNLTNFLEHNIIRRRKNMVSVRNDFPLDAERECDINPLEDKRIAWPLEHGF